MLFTKDATYKRSPIKVKPLRNPGESLQRQLEEYIQENVQTWLVFGFLVVMWAAWEWVRYLGIINISPWSATLIAFVVVGLAASRIAKARAKVRCIRQGIEGEKSVGQALDALRADGYQVFHDIVEDGYNIDHVMVGPTGVYAIETKTISKPTDHDAQIVYDGEKVLVDGHTPDRDPLKQVEACANRVREIIEERTAQKVTVRGVVLYPRWFIQQQCQSPRIWVVNEKYLRGRLAGQPHKLNDAEIQRYAAVLGDYIRGKSSTS